MLNPKEGTELYVVVQGATGDLFIQLIHGMLAMNFQVVGSPYPITASRDTTYREVVMKRWIPLPPDRLKNIKVSSEIHNIRMLGELLAQIDDLEREYQQEVITVVSEYLTKHVPPITPLWNKPEFGTIVDEMKEDK